MAGVRKTLAITFTGIILLGLINETTQLDDYVWQMLKDKQVFTTADFIKTFFNHTHSGKPSVGQPDKPGQPSEPNPPGYDILFNEEGSLNPDGGDILASMVDVERDRCEVKRVSMKIPEPSNDHNVIFWPSCVKLDQCSGCCNNELLECAPILEQTVFYEVARARYPFPGADYFNFEGIQQVALKKHIACECRCRVQPDDCVSGLHIYDPHSCQCKCHNHLEALSCVHPKVWNNNECRCACPTAVRACYDDEEFSEDSCSCVRLTPDNESPEIGNSGPNNGDIYCDKEISCRIGYRAQMNTEGMCVCLMDTHQNMEGSLIGDSRPTRRPRPPSEPVDVVRVPEHPMYVITNTAEPTRAPRPTRRTRRPRRPRY